MNWFGVHGKKRKNLSLLRGNKDKKLLADLDYSNLLAERLLVERRKTKIQALKADIFFSV